MNKGIVMEMTKKSIIVMRPDGTFDRLPRRKRECEVGEEIEYAERSFRWRTPSAAGKSALVAAVVFGLVLFASFNGKLGSSDVVAYISMDINPSVEMGIDVRETVLELKGLNEDGSRLVQAVNFKGKTLKDVTEELLDQAEQGALSQGEAEIVIASTVIEEGEHFSDLLIAEKVKQTVSEHIQETHPEQAAAYQVATFAAPQEVREAAKQNGVSMGKYSVYLTAKSNGAQVTLDEIKQTSVLQLTKSKPEIAKLILPDKTPTKDQIKQWVEEEKNGRLGVFAGETPGNTKNPTDGQKENPDERNGDSEGDGQKDGTDQKDVMNSTSSNDSSDSAAAGSEERGNAPGGNVKPSAKDDAKAGSGNDKDNGKDNGKEDDDKNKGKKDRDKDDDTQDRDRDNDRGNGRKNDGRDNGESNNSGNNDTGDRKGRPAAAPSASRQDRGDSSDLKPGTVFPGVLLPAAFGDAGDAGGSRTDSRNGKAEGKRDQDKSKEEENRQKEDQKRNEASSPGPWQKRNEASSPGPWQKRNEAGPPGQWQKRNEAGPPAQAKKTADEERREDQKEGKNKEQQSQRSGESEKKDTERRGVDNKPNPNDRQESSGSRNVGNRGQEDQDGQNQNNNKQNEKKDEKKDGKIDSRSDESGRKAGERGERDDSPESPWRGGPWHGPNDAPRGNNDGKSGFRYWIESVAA